MPPPAFAFHAVTVRRGADTILDHVDLAVPGDGITVVVGPSGAGKSTLLRLCNRLEVPSSGVVEFHGHDVAALDPLTLRRRAGMVFQRPALFAGTVADNLRVAAPQREDDFATALEQVGLSTALLERAASTLSGGEAQRVCLARTLLTEPDALLADEPTAALDARPRLAFERLACRLADQGVTVVWVTHDLAQARRLADHLVVLQRGRVVETGAYDDVSAGHGAGGAFLRQEDRDAR